MMEEEIVETFTLVANMCSRCGCLYVPLDGAVCPVSGSHRGYTEVHLTMSRQPEKWPEGTRKIVTKG